MADEQDIDETVGDYHMGLMGFPVFPPNALIPPPPPWPSNAWPTNALMPFAPPLPYRWVYVRRRFDQLLANLTITDTQQKNGQISQARIRDCLNRHYWGYGSETANSMLIGSWGKDTRNRPPATLMFSFSYREKFTGGLTSGQATGNRSCYKRSGPFLQKRTLKRGCAVMGKW